MASDRLNQVGKSLRQTQENADYALARLKRTVPIVERVRDGIDKNNSFLMKFNLEDEDTKVKLDLNFFKPSPMNDSNSGEGIMSKCESFTNGGYITLEHPYIAGSVSVYLDGVILPSSQWYESSPENGQVYVGVNGNIVICYLYGNLTYQYPSIVQHKEGDYADFSVIAFDNATIAENLLVLSYAVRDGAGGLPTSIMESFGWTRRYFKSYNELFNWTGIEVWTKASTGETSWTLGDGSRWGTYEMIEVESGTYSSVEDNNAYANNGATATTNLTVASSYGALLFATAVTYDMDVPTVASISLSGISTLLGDLTIDHGKFKSGYRIASPGSYSFTSIATGQYAPENSSAYLPVVIINSALSPIRE